MNCPHADCGKEIPVEMIPLRDAAKRMSQAAPPPKPPSWKGKKRKKLFVQEGSASLPKGLYARLKNERSTTSEL